MVAFHLPDILNYKFITERIDKERETSILKLEFSIYSPAKQKVLFTEKLVLTYLKITRSFLLILIMFTKIVLLLLASAYQPVSLTFKRSVCSRPTSLAESRRSTSVG